MMGHEIPGCKSSDNGRHDFHQLNPTTVYCTWCGGSVSYKDPGSEEATETA